MGRSMAACLISTSEFNLDEYSVFERRMKSSQEMRRWDDGLVGLVERGMSWKGLAGFSPTRIWRVTDRQNTIEKDDRI